MADLKKQFKRFLGFLQDFEALEVSYFPPGSDSENELDKPGNHLMVEE
jgi:hypothetical protein